MLVKQHKGGFLSPKQINTLKLLKKTVIIVLFVVSLQSCLTISQLYTKDEEGYWGDSDFAIHGWDTNTNDYAYVEFEVGCALVVKKSNISYLRYIFRIYKYNYDSVKLNYIVFTKRQDKEIIPITNLCYRSSDPKEECDSIKYLPLVIRGYRRSLNIYAETAEPYEPLRKVYVSYDIIVGDRHIVKKNVKYKCILVWVG